LENNAAIGDLMITSREIVKSTSLLSLITLFSLGFGFFKEIIVANYFGAGQLVDAFLVAIIIPLSVPRILTLVISLCFIPAYIEAQKKCPRDAQNLLNFVLITMLLVLLIGMALFYWQAPGIISKLAPGFDKQTLSLSITLLQLTLPILIFFGLFRLFASLLNAHRSFMAPGLAVFLSPICVIAAITLFGTSSGAHRWAVGLTIGHGLQAAFLLGFILRRGIRPGLRVNLHNPGVKSFLRSAIPLMCATGINTLLVIIDRSMASQLLPGSISSLSYADKIFQVPLQTFILSITTVMLPYASLQFLQADKGDFKKTIRLAILMAAFVLLPVTTGLVIMARPIVAALLQRGAFDAQDTLVTSQALIGFASGFFTVAIYYILQRILIVIRKTLWLIGIAVINVALKILFNLLFINIYGAPGIALASTIMFTLTAALMVILVYRFLGGLRLRGLAFTVMKFALASLSMALVCLVGQSLFSRILPQMSTGVQFIKIILVISFGLGSYAGMVWALRIPEARKLAGMLLRLAPFKAGV